YRRLGAWLAGDRRRLFAALAAEAKDAQGPLAARRLTMIRLESLTKTYASPQGTVTAVDRVSLEVGEGEICVLLGPSGCGKTTTLRMINRLVAPTSGNVVIAGRDTEAADPVELRRGIGYVIQQNRPFPEHDRRREHW